jgi:glycine dehydrogenase subunit 2
MKKNVRIPLSIEDSRPGHEGFSLPRSTMPAAPAPAKARKNPLHFPEMSELDVVRHFTKLSQMNYSIDAGMYPLGSCTMKYNPRINEFTASHPGFTRLHPRTPPAFAQGALSVMYHLENALAEISGFSRITLQPAAGAHGEYLGIKMIKAWMKKNGLEKKKILIPESAHGTNGASAAMCGYEVLPVKTRADGMSDLEQIDALSREGQVAALMITNPSTLGLFETQIEKICKLLHDRQALVYCDGANMNAMLGTTRPGDAGIDVMHFNLHKTFTTPHGGGGPGCGAVGVSKTLVPFLPVPTVERSAEGENLFHFEEEHPDSVGKIKNYYGHFLMMVRAYTYISELGADGLRKVGEDSVLLANYIRKRLEGHYELPFKSACMHEVIFTDKIQNTNGVKTLDIAKRIIDLGYHPPTIYFPLIVSGAMMIEPTETESLQTVEHFCEVMIQIAKEAKEPEAFAKYFANAPRTTPTGRVSETLAAKQLHLSWKDLE